MTERQPSARSAGAESNALQEPPRGSAVERGRDEARRKRPDGRTDSWAFGLEVEPRVMLQNYVEML